MLQPRKKLSRREIKEDPLVTFYGNVQRWFQSHGRIVNIIAISVVAIAVVSILMARSKRQAEISAEEQLGVTEQYYHFGQYERAIDDLKRIVDTFSGTRAAGKAVFFLANAYFDTQDYANAEKNYRLYVDDYGQIDMFTSSSLAGIAACLENRQDEANAAQFYEKAAKDFPDHFSAPFQLKNAARCYLQVGQIEKARELHRQIRNNYKDTSVAKEIDVLSQSI
jgi:TolA-binding protein